MNYKLTVHLNDKKQIEAEVTADFAFTVLFGMHEILRKAQTHLDIPSIAEIRKMKPGYLRGGRAILDDGREIFGQRFPMKFWESGVVDYKLERIE